MGCSKDQSPGHTTARTHPAAPWKEKACILVPIAGSACAGTTLRYRPGLITGGSGLTHDCGKARGMGYFLEPLVCMALFGKKVRIASHCTDYVCFGNTAVPLHSRGNASSSPACAVASAHDWPKRRGYMHVI